MLVQIIGRNKQNNKHIKPKKMKKLAIIATALILITTVSVQALPARRVLTFKDALGRTLTMPEFVEEAIDELPVNHNEIVKQVKAESAAQVFDLSHMSRQETMVNDIPAGLEGVIRY